MLAPHGHVGLDVVADLIFLDDGVAALNDQHPFLMVFVDFVAHDVGKGFFFHFDPRLSIKPDEVVVGDLAAIVLALDQHAVQAVADDRHIFGNVGFAEKAFIGPAKDAVLFVLLDLIQDDGGEGAVNLNPLFVLSYDVATDLGLAGQPHFNPHLVTTYRIADYLQLKLFAHQMHSQRVVLDVVLDDLRVVVPDPPKQQRALLMVTQDAVFQEEGP